MRDNPILAALGGEILDWRYRWIPPDWYGGTIAEVVAARPGLFTVDGPVATLDNAALEHNLSTMAGWCERVGVWLAPHGKTTMAPQLVARQIANGGWGVTVASLAQARVYRAFGADTVIVANEIVDPAGLRWLAAEYDKDPAFRVLCWVDSVAGVEALAGAWAGTGASRALEILLELGFAGGRTGCRTADLAHDVARAAASAASLRLVGVAGYEGILDDVAEVDRFLVGMRDLARTVEPLFQTDEVILSAGGSAYFDRVAEILAPDTVDRPMRTVIRSGCYLTHDSGHYAALTPSARGVAGAPEFRAAARVWARVLSRPEPGLALLGAGRRDLPYDQGLPVASIGTVTALNDQHAYLTVDPGVECGPGDWVALGISHPCTLFDRWNLLAIVDGDTIVDLVRTYF